MNQEPSEEGGDSMTGSDFVEPQCDVSSSPIQLRPSSIEEQTQVGILQVGGPLESGELWFGRSLRSDLSAWSNFTAYHPIWNSGVFMRYQYSTIMLESQATERLLDLENTHTVILGWRGQFRFPELRPR